MAFLNDHSFRALSFEKTKKKENVIEKGFGWFLPSSALPSLFTFIFSLPVLNM